MRQVISLSLNLTRCRDAKTLFRGFIGLHFISHNQNAYRFMANKINLQIPKKGFIPTIYAFDCNNGFRGASAGFAGVVFLPPDVVGTKTVAKNLPSIFGGTSGVP